MSSPQVKPNVISKFSRIFVERYRMSILIILAVVSMGAFAYTTLLDREGFPSIEIPFAIVQAPYFVGDTNVVESEVADPIEEAILNIDEVESTNATITGNFVSIFAESPSGTSSKDGAKILEDEIKGNVELPEGVEVSFLSFEAGKYNGIYDMIVTLTGDKSYEVLQEKAGEVAEEFKKSNNIDDAVVEDIIKEQTNPFTGETSEVQDGFNRVSVEDGDEMQFQKAINIGIIKGNQSLDTIEFSEYITNKVEDIDETIDLEGFEIIKTSDFAIDLNRQITSLESNALSALVIVVAVLFFLVNYRASIITAGFIVVVMTGSLLALYIFGFSLNILSLFALILVLGLIVDDAIVVVEAIDYQKKAGVAGIQAITKAINSVGLADISGTVTTVLVFLPMAVISGVLGDFIKLIPYTVIITLLISVVVGLTLIPFASHFMIPDKKKAKSPIGKIFSKIEQFLNFIPNLFVRLGELVGKLVNFYLKVPVLAIIVIIGSFLLIGFGSSFQSKLDFNIFPNPKDTNEITVTINYENFVDTDSAESIAAEVEQTLVDKYGDEITQVSYPQVTGSNATMSVTLTELNEREIKSTEIVEFMNEIYPQIENTDIYAVVNPATNQTVLSLSYNSLDEQEASDKTEEILKKLDGTSVDFEELGETSSTGASLVSDTLNKEEQLEVAKAIGFYTSSNLISAGPPAEEYQFRTQIYSEDTQMLKDIESDMVSIIGEFESEDGITVTEVARVDFDVINKKDNSRFIEIKAKLSEGYDANTVNDLTDYTDSYFSREIVSNYNISQDAISFDLGQESDNLESFNSAIVTTLVALIVMYILLVVQFNSFTLPLLIFTAIPFSFPGLFPGLYITDNPFSFFTVIGIIGLIGIVVNNTIMLLDFAKQEQAEGKTIRESIVDAVSIRFRPVLTTSLTTVVGLLPLALTDPFWESLGFSIIFGLISSTLMVIFIFPAYYMALEYTRFFRNEFFQNLKHMNIKGILEMFKNAGKKMVYPIIR